MHTAGVNLPKSRRDFGLPSGGLSNEAHDLQLILLLCLVDATLYVCPQSMHKMHPEFDLMMADVLRKDPKG